MLPFSPDRSRGDSAPADPWQTLRRARRITFGLWLGWIPFALLVMILQDGILPSPWPVLLAVGYLAGFFVSGLRAMVLLCPRCQRNFFRLFTRQRLWNWRCASCGVDLGGSSDPPRESLGRIR